MVSVGVTKLSYTSLIFGSYYRDVLLSQQLLPAICQVSGEFLIIQQDGLNIRRAHVTINLLECETPAFVSTDFNRQPRPQSS